MHGVAVVVLDFDQASLTSRCLRSLHNGGQRPDLVVVVENGRLRVPGLDSYGFSIVVLRAGTNLGCGGGRNLALNYLQANTAIRTFIVLDNDTVADPRFIAQVRTAPPPPMKVVAPILYDFASNEVWSSGGTISDDGGIVQRNDVHVNPATVDWAPGACLVFDRATWVSVGPFDAWLNFLFEDVDWCCRLRRAGGSIMVVPALQLRHEAHASLGGRWSPQRVWHWSRNGTVFRVATLRISTLRVIKWLASESLLSVRDAVLLRWPWARARFCGLVEGTVEGMRRRRRGEPPRT